MLGSFLGGNRKAEKPGYCYFCLSSLQSRGQIWHSKFTGLNCEISAFLFEAATASGNARSMSKSSILDHLRDSRLKLSWLQVLSLDFPFFFFASH